MALTKQQEITLYQILKVPWSSTVNRVMGPDNNTAEAHTADVSNRQARSMITNYLTDTIYTDSDVENELKRLLNAWISLGFTATNLDAGGMGSISGIMDDPRDEREIIRENVKIIVPFYMVHETITTNQDNRGFLSICR